VILAVGLDTAGERAAADFARASEAGPLGRPPAGVRLGRPTYPVLRDEQHVVAQLYDITNVPMAVWVDEQGRIVRPPEPAGAYDVVRHIDLKTFKLPEDVAARASEVRARYLDAVRDWARHGAQSRFALAPDEVARRARGPGEAGARGHACFALGAWLWRHGQRAAAGPWLEEAVRLRPESWAFRRQKIAVADEAAIGNFAATPEAGGRYYDRIDMPGMPED
jgi:hypothetical protein